MLTFSARSLALPFLFSAASVWAAADATPAPEGWFVWPAVEPMAGSALDVSALNATPAGKSGRIAVRDGHFILPNGERVRFWGCNIGGADVFVPADEAKALARRLSRGGVNIARLHHMDNQWGVNDGGSIWPKGGEHHTQIDRGQLDKLHRLIAELRDQGIYSNINLKVSKTLGPADGFPASVSQFPDFQKRVDIFSRRMIELQKDYARQLLTTKNPYTGHAPADDPAVAVIEINNENSLLGYFTRDLGQGLDAYPEPFRGELKSLWNAWLKKHYADTPALATAWRSSGGAGAQLLPANAKWFLKRQPGASAKILDEPKPGADGFAVTVDQASGVDWHVQLVTLGLQVEEGVVYAVEFEAKADVPRSLQVGVANDTSKRPGEDWRSFGLLQHRDIGTEWTKVRFVFPAHSVAGSPASLAFNFGAKTGTTQVRNLRFAPSAGVGLAANESPAAGSVDLPRDPTTGQWRDWIAFLADTERAYAEEMRDFLKKELHVKAPIACSQIDFGGITAVNRERSMDYADAHSYWEHPDFPAGAGWDRNRWTIRNTPQIAKFGPRSFGSLGNLALTRIAGKPFSVSEYDHAAPSDFACEMYPELAVIGGRQDWDAIYPFALDAFGERNPENRLMGFFDQIQHPAKWGFGPFATTVFRRGWIAPAPASAVVHPGEPVWRDSMHADLLWQKLLPGNSLEFLDRRFGMQDTPAARDAAAKLVRDDTVTAGSARVTKGAAGPVLTLAESRAAAIVGFVGGTTTEAGPVRVRCEKFGRNFASITALSLDGAPLASAQRVLVTLAARGENSGMRWNETRTSVGANWGTGPTVAERVPATITFASVGKSKVYPLRPDGSRGLPVATQAADDGSLAFTVQPADATMHYEIVRGN